MSQRLDALMVREYTTREGETKASFTKVGTAFANQNGGGYTLVLEAVPVPSIGKDGAPQIRLLLREPLPPRDGQGQGGQRPQQQRPAQGQRKPGGWQPPNGGPTYSNEDAGNGAYADDDIPF